MVSTESTTVLVDCGFSLVQINHRINQLGMSCADLDAVLVTHEHSDHWAGVMPLAIKYEIPVVMTAGCGRAVKANGEELVRIIDSQTQFTIGDLLITPVTVPHDAIEPVQYLFEHDSRCLGLLTDLGHFTKYIFDRYKMCDALFVEANHDRGMLREGSYPQFLKQRVAGNWGHLDNDQVGEFLKTVDQDRLQHLLIGHISENNNCLSKVKKVIDSTGIDFTKVHYATQNVGCGWLCIR